MPGGCYRHERATHRGTAWPGWAVAQPRLPQTVGRRDRFAVRLAGHRAGIAPGGDLHTDRERPPARHAQRRTLRAVPAGDAGGRGAGRPPSAPSRPDRQQPRPRPADRVDSHACRRALATNAAPVHARLRGRDLHGLLRRRLPRIPAVAGRPQGAAAGQHQPAGQRARGAARRRGLLSGLGRGPQQHPDSRTTAASGHSAGRRVATAAPGDRPGTAAHLHQPAVAAHGRPGRHLQPVRAGDHHPVHALRNPPTRAQRRAARPGPVVRRGRRPARLGRGRPGGPAPRDRPGVPRWGGGGVRRDAARPRRPRAAQRNRAAAGGRVHAQRRRARHDQRVCDQHPPDQRARPAARAGERQLPLPQLRHDPARCPARRLPRADGRAAPGPRDRRPRPAVDRPLAPAVAHPSAQRPTVAHARNIRTPPLILHAEQDLRCRLLTLDVPRVVAVCDHQFMVRRVSSAVLVGRDDELSRLRAAFRHAVAGSPATVVVAGEAGVGKTRLVLELAREAEVAGAVVLVGGCLDVGGDTLPYAPLAEALRSLPMALGADELAGVLDGARGELARLVPELGEPAAGAAETPPARFLELLLGVLHRLADARAVALVVEDLHWADRSTRDLLAFLVRNLRRGVLLLLTVRSDELHRRHPLRPFLAELERGGRAERIDLRRLTRHELTELLTEILGHATAPGLVADVWDRSDGNPFFAEELAAVHAEGTQLPEALRDLLLARVEALPDAAQRVLQVAAVAGRRVDHHLLATVAAEPEGGLVELLREAVVRHVLAEAPGDGYAFRHALVQEAIYDDLLHVERGPLHAAYARALAERVQQRGGHATAVELGQLAHHWYAANDLRAAVDRKS